MEEPGFEPAPLTPETDSTIPPLSNFYNHKALDRRATKPMDHVLSICSFGIAALE